MKATPSMTCHAPILSRCLNLGAALVTTSLLLFATASSAQDEAVVKAGLNAWKASGCSECHGAFANGEKERDEAPTGADLRTTRLDDATLREVIRCGRVSTGMPRFGEDAYTQRGCYGQGPGPVPDALYPTPRMMSAPEIDAVVAYLRARVIGKRGEVTPQECAAYYEELAATFC
jgi:mono/diheme cytochrome c family protein